ncbi:FUSC family protein [Achromobacter sp.]|uniref:FUSC family protein n=1 Tax=Achromobacter sp. TaxID=134375 RepID=UPI0028A98B1C|nr:aromatic acid exporter family protein [Achromobacter sp.]
MFFNFSSLLKRAADCRTAIAQDGVRLPLQTVTAVLLAYGWMTWRQMPDVTWGAFSALFVVRATVEGTVGEAGARILGAMIGVAVGVGLAPLAATGHLPAPWSIVVGVGIAACLSMRWPTLNYSLVTATILTVAPDADIVAGAVNKTLAIVVGSAAGILAAFAVLPLSARRSLRYNLAASLQIYGELLVEWAAALGEGRQRPRPRDKPAMERTRWRARDMATQSRAVPMQFMAWDSEAYRLQDRIDELWLTVPLLERVGGVELTDNVCVRLGPVLDAVAAAARQQIDELAHAIRENGAEAPMCRTGDPFTRLDDVIQEAGRGGLFTPAERETIDLIRWTWHEVTRELDALCDCMQARPA